jgi:hypothetical protein
MSRRFGGEFLGTAIPVGIAVHDVLTGDQDE